MRSRRLPALAAACLALLGLSGGPALAESGLDVVKGKCLTCHNAKRLCRGLGLKDKAGWARTIHRMATERGAKLSLSDQTLARDYLAAHTPESTPLCK